MAWCSGSRRRRLAGASVGVAVAVSIAAGCSSGDGDDGGDATGATPAASAPSTPSEIATSTAAVATAATATTAVTAPSGAPTTIAEPLATVTEQGVPGIDSEDPFCRGWSEFAGSFQALTLASLTGSDPFTSARLEVVAAAAVLAAVETIDASYPDPIADERDVFIDDVTGPFARRATRAVDELRSAGLTADDLELLGDVWLLTLADAGVDQPELVVAVPPDLAAAVDAATAAFSANVPPIGADPSLITDADAPATFRHLAEQCPDQGTLAGNDAVD